MGFVNMRNLSTGVVESLPEHYLRHPRLKFESTDDPVGCTDCVLPEPEPQAFTLEVELEPEVTPATVFKKSTTRSKED